MLLPFADEPNSRQVPYVTYAIIACNVLVWVFYCWPLTQQFADPNAPETLNYLRALGQVRPRAGWAPHVSMYDLFIFQHAYTPHTFHLTQLFGSMFLHAGWWHLLGNMLFLYIFGDNVEIYIGRLRYLLMYLVTGALGTLCYTALRPHSDIPIIGASGAIAGVLGCYFVWFPQNRVRILVFFLIFVDVILVPARVVLGIFVLFENLLPLLLEPATRSGGGVAYGAHLGGFFAGFIFALGFSPQKSWPQQQSPRIRVHSWFKQLWTRFESVRQNQNDVRNAASEHAAETTLHRSAFAKAVADGAYAQAAALEADMLRIERVRQDKESFLTLADGLTQQGHYVEALALLRRLIGQRMQAPAHWDEAFLARVHLRAGLILWRGLNRGTAAKQHFFDVLDLQCDPRVALAAKQALVAIETQSI